MSGRLPAHEDQSKTDEVIRVRSKDPHLGVDLENVGSNMTPPAMSGTVAVLLFDPHIGPCLGYTRT
jgi:hypothetical protein